MNLDRVAIADRPIEAGVYDWGWVRYSDYDSAGRPGAISVVMFDELAFDGVASKNTIAALYRNLSRPRWRSLLLCYGPVLVGLGLILFGSPAENGWVSQLALILAMLSGWQVWRYSKNLRQLSGAVEVWGTREIENYITGRLFLKQLSTPELAAGDKAAYFELRLKADQLRKLDETVSDNGY